MIYLLPNSKVAVTRIRRLVESGIETTGHAEDSASVTADQPLRLSKEAVASSIVPAHSLHS